jgi:hypothetical protein
MVAGLEGGVPLSSFWQTWRREIIRGGVLFVGVIAVGLCVRYVVARAKEGVAHGLPALRNLRQLRGLGNGNFNIGDMSAGPRTTAPKWTYSLRVGPKQWVWIRNANGAVHVEPGTGDLVQVTAVKSYRQSDPASVRLQAVPYAGGVAICALWPGSGGCAPGEGAADGPGGGMHRGPGGGNDVAVDFTVRVPRRVRVGAITVNGSVTITGASAPVVAASVNGAVDAETSAGPVTATSVNGSVHARVRAFSDTGEVSLTTVNGSATAELPAKLDAEVEASTLTGGIETDYPLTVTGKVGKQMQGTLGAGGRKVHITTVNGSITMRKVP